MADKAPTYVGGAQQALEIKNATGGKEVREPVAVLLEKVNNSYGDVDYIVDEDGNGYTKRDILTSQTLLDYFLAGTKYLNNPPDRKSTNYMVNKEKAMKTSAIYRKLKEVDSILSLIIGTTGG